MMKKAPRSVLFASVAALLLGSAMAGSMAIGLDKGAGIKVGQVAPPFSLTDQNGKTINLGDYTGKIVVLEWFNNECPFVQKHYKAGNMNATAKKYTDQGVVWLAINTTKNKTNEDNKKIAAEWSINRPILNDASGDIGHAYGAKTTPHMYIIGKDGTLAYVGAIDSKSTPDTADIASSTNYVAAALDELLAGKPISTPETKSYGCSVKYAK